MPATMTHESSHEPQASTFALYRPGFACRAVLLPPPARQRPMKSPPMSMFPKASLTGRIVPANNMMRMAKSWGHGGGPVPAPHGRQTEMRWQCTKRLSALSPQHCSAAEVAAIMRVSFTQRRTNVISAHERYFTNSRRFLSDAAPRQRPAGTPPVATPTGLPAQCCSGR